MNEWQRAQRNNAKNQRLMKERKMGQQIARIPIAPVKANSHEKITDRDKRIFLQGMKHSLQLIEKDARPLKDCKSAHEKIMKGLTTLELHQCINRAVKDVF